MVDISIHTPLAGSDELNSTIAGLTALFQSTLPLRGATSVVVARPHVAVISIHTPLAGSDTPCEERKEDAKYFNPHSPCGERRADYGRSGPGAGYFNPHSPCGERRRGRSGEWCRQDFNPHSPCGERRYGHVVGGHAGHISIHTPLAGSDAHVTCQSSDARTKFQSTLPLRGATHHTITHPSHDTFQSTLPLRGATGQSVQKSSSTIFQSTLPLRGATGHESMGRGRR